MDDGRTLSLKPPLSLLRGPPGKDHMRHPFDKDVKRQCWEKAEMIFGRDPARWRRDAAGTPVIFNLRGKMGLCGWQFDHIIPVKSPESTGSLSNCQVLSSLVNARKKAAEITNEELKELRTNLELTDAQLDLAELIVYGNLKNAYGAYKCKCISKAQEKGDKVTHADEPACKMPKEPLGTMLKHFLGQHDKPAGKPADKPAGKPAGKLPRKPPRKPVEGDA